MEAAALGGGQARVADACGAVRAQRGDLVRCVDPEGKEVARGLSNYNAIDAKKLLGRVSTEIESILGFGGDEELIHRDNLIITR